MCTSCALWASTWEVSSSDACQPGVSSGGFSLADAEGGDLWDPEADAAFVESLRDALRPDIPFEQVDAHVDDPDFAELVADRYMTILEEPAHAG